jgi:hypothetical protein
MLFVVAKIKATNCAASSASDCIVRRQTSRWLASIHFIAISPTPLVNTGWRAPLSDYHARRSRLTPFGPIPEDQLVGAAGIDYKSLASQSTCGAG